MKPRDVVKALRANGAKLVRTKGSHQRWESPDGTCKTTVSVHKGEEIPPGTLRAIEADMAPAFGKGWLLGD